MVMRKINRYGGDDDKKEREEKKWGKRKREEEKQIPENQIFFFLPPSASDLLFPHSSPLKRKEKKKKNFQPSNGSPNSITFFEELFHDLASEITTCPGHQIKLCHFFLFFSFVCFFF